jgi:hypothetical protein
LLNESVHRTTLALVVAFLAAAAVICWRGRSHRAVRAGGVWLALSALPVMGVAPSLSSMMHDRVLYLPSIGVALMLAGLLDQGHRRSREVGSVVLAVVIAATAFTSVLSNHWRVAGRETARLVAGLVEVLHKTQTGCLVRVAGIPDNYRGAYMLRNGTVAALRLHGVPAADANRVQVLSHYWWLAVDRVPIRVRAADRRVEIEGVDGRPEVVMAFGDAFRVGRVEADLVWDRHARHTAVRIELAAAGAVVAPEPGDASRFEFVQVCP